MAGTSGRDNSLTIKVIVYSLFQVELIMEAYLNDKTNGRLELPSQPYSFFLNQQNEVESAFVVTENSALHVPSVEEGLNLRYKCFYVFTF